jgi:hypothetical protein
MIRALLLFGVFAGCLWVAYVCLRQVLRAATAQRPPSGASPAPADPPEAGRRTTPVRR